MITLQGAGTGDRDHSPSQGQEQCQREVSQGTNQKEARRACRSLHPKLSPQVPSEKESSTGPSPSHIVLMCGLGLDLSVLRATAFLFTNKGLEMTKFQMTFNSEI